MGKYKFSTESESSELDDGNGKIYRFKRFLGKGVYDKANEFSSTDGISIAVLKPRGKIFKISLERKRDFFERIYGTNSTSIYYQDEDYRLVVPYLPGQTYTELIDSGVYASSEARSLLNIIPLFLSAITALKIAHEKDIIVIDLKSDNILYDHQTKTSFLIDGGISWPNKKLFKLLKTIPRKERVHCPHIAPECFDVSIASPAMDVYSLGLLMLVSLHKMQCKDNRLVSLSQECLNENPASRPSLVDVEEKLTALLNVEEVYSYLCNQDLNIDIVYAKIANNPQLIAYICKLQKIEIYLESEKELLNTILKFLLSKPIKKETISAILQKAATKRELKTFISTLQEIFGVSVGGPSVLGFLKPRATSEEEEKSSKGQFSPHV